MNISKPFLIVVLSIAVLFIHCDKKTTAGSNRVVIGISADVQTFNPLFAFSVDEGSITELLYLGLFDFRWDEETGDLKSYPMLAEEWEWAEDSSSIKIFLRDDVYWTDGKQLTTDDVILSFDLFSDPEVNSRLYGTFSSMYKDENNHIDIKKSFKDISEYELTITFPKNSKPTLNEMSIPILPSHIYGKIKRDELNTSETNFNPVSNGPFKFLRWSRNQNITLTANTKSFLYEPDNINELVFKIIPDYISRTLQLNKGEIDLMELVKTEDIEDMRKNQSLNIVSVVGREYDYIGWNNIDLELFNKENKIKPHKLFGNKNVRIALSHAINNQEILEEYLLNYGEIAVTPVSKIFKKYYNPKIKAYDYNIGKAKKLLAAEDWKDTDNNGILDKNNTEFRFTLYFPSGNPLRNYASTIIKNNLASIGIEMKIVNLEMGSFIDHLYEKKMDAWMAAWYIPIPVELKSYWYSDLEMTPLNFVSYQNKQADDIINELEQKISDKRKKDLYFKFQEIIHNDQPVTFLYWIPNITVYNKRIKNIHITPLGSITHCWEWKISD